MDGIDWEAIPSKASPANPAAGADFSYTVPAGKRGRLTLLTAELQNDANVANRTVRLSITDAAGHAVLKYPAAANFSNQTAGILSTYEWGVGLPASDGADQVDRSGPLADYLELPAGTVIATTTTNKQVGDQWEIFWNYKEIQA